MSRFQTVIRKTGSRVAGVLMLGAVRAIFGFFRLLGPDRSSALGGALARAIGPLMGVNRVAMANLRATFPDKPEAELKAIARKSWENLGRTAGEYPHLAEIFDYDYDNPDPDGRIQVSGIEHFIALREDEKPGVIFSAHLANWELPAICAARYDLAVTAVFRAPNDPAIAGAVQEIRSQTMGGLEAARPGAAFAMVEALENGGHLGMLIDQHFTRGVVTQFLGRPCLTNPIMGKFARRFDCPVHGARVIRLDGARFRIELTPPLDLPRDAAGEIDVAGAMQAMTDVVADWVLEHPEQWLWMHRRWRPQFIKAPKSADQKPAEPPGAAA